MVLEFFICKNRSLKKHDVYSVPEKEDKQKSFELSMISMIPRRQIFVGQFNIRMMRMTFAVKLSYFE